MREEKRGVREEKRGQRMKGEDEMGSIGPNGQQNVGFDDVR